MDVLDAEDHTDTPAETEHDLPDLDAMLPLVRWYELQEMGLFDRRQFVYIDRERLMAGNVGRGFAIGDEMFGRGARDFLRANASKIKHPVNLQLVQIASVTAERTSLTDGFHRNRTAVRFIIGRNDADFVHKFMLPLVEAPFVLATLAQLLGTRLTIANDVSDAIAQRERAKTIESERQHLANRASAGSIPRRRPVLGAALMFVAGAFLLAWPLAAMLENWVLLIASIFIGVPLFGVVYGYGRALRVPLYEDAIASDRRSPILYLRSFGSEDVVIPERPPGAWGRVVIRLWYRAWPLAMVGMAVQWMVGLFHTLRGRASQRLEEQLVAVFRRFGPVVAIGRPGEAIATAGASRAYLGDDSWQDFVLARIDAAQLILLQIESTEGTWWEFRQCVARVRPERLLLMLTAKLGSQQRYDEMRVLAEKSLGVQLPRNMGDAGFLYFDADWTVHRAPLVWRNFLTTGLMGSPVNMRRTLAPVIARLRA